MSLHVAFLRGMNLGRRRITNAELCACFTEMGLARVSAFLASGNVIFEAPGAAARLASAMAEGLERSLAYPVPTFLRSAAEVEAIAGRRPFTGAELDAGGKPQVLLLGSAPARAARDLVLGLATADDRLVLDGRELYWLPRAGILDSELDLRLIEKTVGPTTMRTLRTLERLSAKLVKLG